MYIRNRFLFMAYKALFIILCLAGLYLNSGLPDGQIRWGVLNYYTIQSNILCLIYFICSFCWNLQSLRQENSVYTYAPRFKGAVVFAITITGLIYHFILVPVQFSTGNGAQVYSLGNILVHYVVPLMVVLDWLLFDPKGNYKVYDPFLWVVIPYTYFIFAVIRAQAGGNIPGTNSRYPYGFINVDILGWEQVLLNIGKLTLIFLVIGYIYYCMDHFMRKES